MRVAALGKRPRSDASITTQSVAECFADHLVALGVTTVFGIVGGAVAPIAHALDQHPKLRVIHTRHESGAAFAAAEASLATGQPVVVMTTTGPGLTNALTGLYTARYEGAKVLLVSGATSPNRRERFAVQESTPAALDPGLYRSGPLFHYATLAETPAEIAMAFRRIARGLRRPHGFVAHVAVPTDLQTRSISTATPVDADARGPERRLDPADVVACADRLHSGKVVLWVGFGARHCADAIAAVADRLGAWVMATPRAKGVFDEHHPRYLGVTGLGGHRGPGEAMAALQPDHVLVLGTRLGELSSSYDPGLCPRRAFIHVDVDPDVPGRAYPETPTFAIAAELGAFLDALLAALPPRPRAVTEAPPGWTPMPATGVQVPQPDRPVRPVALVDAMQRILVEQADARVLADAGNAFAWTIHYLRFARPGRYRANLGWGSMGHASAGVLGLAMHEGPTVALVGDGAMLMNCELSTAVQYQIDAIWIVLNDSQYGMVEHGMRNAGLQPVQTSMPGTHFAELARSMGAEGICVTAEDQLDDALRRALEVDGPCVVDVVVDPCAVAPSGRRFAALRDQGVVAGGAR